MKINKNMLTEEIEEIEVIDPSDSVAEIADAVQDHVEVADGDTTLTPQAATQVAQEIVQTGSEVGADKAVVVADFEALGTDNEITRTLEAAFEGAKRNARRGIKSGNNVLIIGLPGSGKTASVYDWANSKKEVNLVYINAKNNDLEAYINGYTVRNADDPSKVGQAYSDNLADLEKPNSVLFLDEYNRQVKPHIRASLYTLINEHKIAGTGPNKTHEFKNLLFTVACINPAVPTDRGAAELNDAEISRFAHVLANADSSVDSIIDYLKRMYDKKIAQLDPKDSYYLEDLEGYLRMQDLGIFIVSHRDFAFNTYDDLEDLKQHQRKMLNQRSLSEGITVADGKVDAFKKWLQTRSHFLDKDVEMIMDILTEYVEPTLEQLCELKGINLSTGEITKPDDTQEIADTPTEAEPQADLEDDDDFFSNSGVNAGSARVKNPQEVADAIKAAVKNW